MALLINDDILYPMRRKHVYKGKTLIGCVEIISFFQKKKRYTTTKAV